MSDDKINLPGLDAVNPELGGAPVISVAEAQKKLEAVLLTTAAENPEVLKTLVLGVSEATKAKMQGDDIVKTVLGIGKAALDIAL